MIRVPPSALDERVKLHDWLRPRWRTLRGQLCLVIRLHYRLPSREANAVADTEPVVNESAWAAIRQAHADGHLIDAADQCRLQLALHEILQQRGPSGGLTLCVLAMQILARARTEVGEDPIRATVLQLVDEGRLRHSDAIASVEEARLVDALGIAHTVPAAAAFRAAWHAGEFEHAYRVPSNIVYASA